MKAKIEKLKSRTYLFIDDKKIKMIPSSYQELPVDSIVDSLNDNSKIFLNNSERFNLEYLLFINEIRSSEKYVYELIEKASVEQIRFVSVKFGVDRYEVLFDNGVRVKCPFSLFHLNSASKTINSDT